MKLSFTQEVEKEIKKIKHKEPKLFNKITKQLNCFRNNPKHPSLRNHKLSGNLSNSYSIYIEENIRMTYYIKDSEAVFFLIGSHDKVYRK